MSDSCLDDDIIESLRNSSMHKKCFRYDRERGRIFIVRKNESKNCANERDSCRSIRHDRREMSCGDHAPLPSVKSCQLKITEPIICTISDPTNFEQDCDNDNCGNSVKSCESCCGKSIQEPCGEYKKCIDKCAAKLNVKKTSKVQLNPNRCPCCCCGSGRINLARKMLGPFPDEIGLSFMDRIAKIFGKAIGCHDELQSCDKLKFFQCRKSSSHCARC